MPVSSQTSEQIVKDNSMSALQNTSYLSGSNAAYLEALYDKYLTNPQSVADPWRSYFASITPNGKDVSHAAVRIYFQELAQRPTYEGIIATTPTQLPQEALQKYLKLFALIEAYRRYGHYQAQLDPLQLAAKRTVAELEINYYGFSEADLKREFSLNGILGLQTTTLQKVVDHVKQIYCGTLGFEYSYIVDNKPVQWLQQRIETATYSYSAEQKKRILWQLTQAEVLERYLGAKYVGQTRFSLEGGESFISLMDQLIQTANQYAVKEVVIGMGHRARLNVLVNTLGKSVKEVCAEFEGKHADDNGSGDVKYHMGFSADVKTQHGIMHLALAFNPSHLEAIDPVVEGAVRAKQQRRDDKKREQVVPLLVHGDAAFSGQGVIMETFSLSQTRGFGTGGTVHIVINNQIGYTVSDPHDARSSWYCTDLAKMVEAPVIHANGDDPEAVLFAAQLAMDFRMTFKKDVVIDLVCFRRLGHNEGDEPSGTQPVMYQKIKQHPGIRKIYAEKLQREGIINSQYADQLVNDYRDGLDSDKKFVDVAENEADKKYRANWHDYLQSAFPADHTVATSVAAKKLRDLATQIETLPQDFTLQPQVAKTYGDRRKMTNGELPLNWGYAEMLAYATLLDQGFSVRLSGQDVRRGTFAHRHAVLHEYRTDQIYIPLEKVTKAPATVTLVDSVLSEEAVMAFEYGYAAASPETLVIWEAQYGDFFNGAQVVVDQFLSSGEQKWGRLSGLTLFLPHGYEGAGPEHSSARLERFLQLCAQDNMRICVPSTPAQIFHLLRRQMLQKVRKPLIMLTPKSLLRHKLAVSTLADLSEGQFQTVLAEVDPIKDTQVRRVILCTGKVYYDLLEQRRAKQIQDVALLRMEEFYPFPHQQLTQLLQRYKKAEEVIWCQEEPKNQGAWLIIRDDLLNHLTKQQKLKYIGRAATAAPATGVKTVHVAEQKALLEEALS